MEPEWFLVVPSYLFGAFLAAVHVGRAVGHDPTREGSRNPGASNMFRIAGPSAGVAVLVIDVLKGALPAALGLAVGGSTLGAACGVAAVAGHVAPITRQFRGGKGVATLGGAYLVLHPLAALVTLAVWIGVFAVTRRASVASLVGVVLIPVGSAVRGGSEAEIALLAGAALVVVWRHRGNIHRLLHREEPAFGRQRSSAT